MLSEVFISHLYRFVSQAFKKFNQNEWKVACGWSSNQRIKRSTVLKGHWIVDECTSSLLDGNPDEIRGMGGRQQQNKNNNLKKNKKQNANLRWDIFLLRSRAEWTSPVWQRWLQCVGPSMGQVLKDMLMLVCECVVRYRIVQRLCVFFLLFLLLRLVSLYLLISRTSE